MIEIIKTNDMKFKKEKSIPKKRPCADRNSNFRAYEPAPRRVIKPQYFTFENIPPSTNDSHTPQFMHHTAIVDELAANKQESAALSFGPLDSTRNMILSPIGNPFLSSPTDRFPPMSAKNYGFPNSTRTYSPSNELRIRSPTQRAWEEESKPLGSTKDFFFAEMVAYKSGGVNAIPNLMESPADIRRPVPVSPHTGRPQCKHDLEKDDIA